MKIDGPFYAELANAATEARRLRDAGFDGIYTLEGSHDPFLPLVVAAEHCPRLDIATGIAVAFPRNPSHIAYSAWDLQQFSGGRFLLGIGSQIKPHIEKRFGVPFSPPAPRMQEYIRAVKAFFDCWQHGRPLRFEGEYYRHTLMTPMFNPGPNPYGPPPILLGAVGPRMTAVAGEVADGLIVHPFNTREFIIDAQLPVLERALGKSGRRREDFIVQAGAICITGANEEEYRVAEQTVKGLLAFYGSTPSYLPPMRSVGVDGLQPELNRLSKQGRWDDMASLVDDRYVRAFTVAGEPDSIAAQLWERYGGLVDRLSIYAPYPASPGVWASVITELKHLAGR